MAFLARYYSLPPHQLFARLARWLTIGSCFSVNYERAKEKRSEKCLRFGTSGPSLCLYPLLSRNIMFFPALAMAARAKRKFWQSNLLTPSACKIWSTLTYAEFDCLALLAML